MLNSQKLKIKNQNIHIYARYPKDIQLNFNLNKRRKLLKSKATIIQTNFHSNHPLKQKFTQIGR